MASEHWNILNNPKIDGAMPMRETRWLLLHIRPYWPRVLWSLMLTTSAGAVATIDPLLMRHLVDRSFPDRHFIEAAVCMSLIAGCFVARSVFSKQGSIAGFRVAQYLGQDLRQQLLNQMTRLSADWHERTMLGDKVSRFDSDVEQIAQFGSDIFGQIVNAVGFLTLNLIIMLRLNVVMTLTLVPLLPLFYLVRLRFRRIIQIRATETQEGMGQAIGRITEHLGGMIQLQLLDATGAKLADSVSSWGEVIESQWRQRRSEAAFSIAVSVVLGLGILGAPLLGVWEYARGAATLGTIVAFYAYAKSIFEPISSAMELYARSQRVMASAKRVLDVMDEMPTVPDTGAREVVFPRLRYGLSMESVSYSYVPDYEVLRDVSFTVFSGEAVALVGLSGSGKSSVGRLAVRLADPLKGRVLVDRRDAREFSLSALRRTLNYLPQTPVLFRGTIRENLMCANPQADQPQLDAAISAARLDGVLGKFARGLDHPLQANASGLSGGEQQRVAIARALLRDSPVLILDEATSALDAPTEDLVLQAIRQLRPDMSMLIISHRVRALQWVNRFLVLDHGSIVADGDHQKLYRESAHYRSLLWSTLEEGTPTLLDRVAAYLDRVNVNAPAAR